LINIFRIQPIVSTLPPCIFSFDYFLWHFYWRRSDERLIKAPTIYDSFNVNLYWHFVQVWRFFYSQTQREICWLCRCRKSVNHPTSDADRWRHRSVVWLLAGDDICTCCINFVNFMLRAHLAYFGLFGLFGLLWHHRLLSSTLGTEGDDHSFVFKYRYVGWSVIPNSKLFTLILLRETEHFRKNLRNM
jgi:hypothetical protein